MIKPTIGRVVWFTPSHAAGTTPPNSQPLAALVAYVHGDTCVNIGGFDQNGNHFAACSVRLLQDDEPKPETGYYVEWMPYQKGQAAKTEHAEAVAAAIADPIVNTVTT